MITQTITKKLQRQLNKMTPFFIDDSRSWEYTEKFFIRKEADNTYTILIEQHLDKENYMEKYGEYPRRSNTYYEIPSAEFNNWINCKTVDFYTKFSIAFTEHILSK